MRFWFIAALIAPGGLVAGLIAAPFVWLYRRRKIRNRVQVVRPTLTVMKGGRE